MTHKKVVVRTIQTRDGQVKTDFAFWSGMCLISFTVTCLSEERSKPDFVLGD